MGPPAPRSSFSLPAAGDLRDRAHRAAQQARRRGRPRDRFLADRRATLVRYLVPCLALASIIGASVAVVDVAFASFAPDQRATLAEAGASVSLAIAVGLLVALRRNLRALLVIHGAAAVTSEIAWGFAARFTGGASSPYMLARTLLDHHSHNFRDLTLAGAAVIGAQMAGLPASSLQVDEANIPGNPADAPLAAEAINRVLDAIDRGTQRAVHF